MEAAWRQDGGEKIGCDFITASQIINQNGVQATSGSEMCFCYPYAQDKCPIVNQRSLFHP